MNTLSFQEFVDFINAQPDERPLDMGNNFKDENCGCLLVEFGKEKGLHFGGCSFSGIGNYDFGKDALKAYRLVRNAINISTRVKNFKDAKELLNNLVKDGLI